MTWLISNNKQMLEALQLKIHNYMKATVANYKADRWATIIKHPTQNLYAVLIKETDPRKPYGAISDSEKQQLTNDLDDSWNRTRTQP